jgi:hypothetical protein
MYTNIPTEELINIVDGLCEKHNIENTLKMENVRIARLIIAQNNFIFREKPTYKRMASPWGHLRHPFYLKSTCNLWKTRKSKTSYGTQM